MPLKFNEMYCFIPCFQLDNKLTNFHFVGCIEDVKFDGLPVGMWDFVEGENNNRGCNSRSVNFIFQNIPILPMALLTFAEAKVVAPSILPRNKLVTVSKS